MAKLCGVGTGYTKRALKRENDGTPIGTPGNMYLDCECGNHLPMPSGADIVICVCGIQYDARGWIVGKC